MNTGLLARVALMLGNFVIGVGILAPAGMLDQLADGLGVSVADAGLLVTYGAVVLCFGSPLMAWATTRVDRRTLLAATLLIFAVGHAASALAPNYAVLLTIRLLMLVFAAIYTPQAASTVALIVPEKLRSGAIAFVFLGWSLAVAVGLPIVTAVAASLGWRATFALLGGFAVVSSALLAFSLPPGLTGARVSLATWTAVARNRLILLLLAITALQTAGPFIIFTYLGPLVKALASGGAGEIESFFAIFGITGFIGNLIATRLVVLIGAYRVSLLFQGSMLLGARRLVARCRHPRRHGDRRRPLGPRLRRVELDAAGAPGRRRSQARQRLGRAQHVVDLCRPGDRLRPRRAAVNPRLRSRHGLCRGCVPARGLRRDPADEAEGVS